MIHSFGFCKTALKKAGGLVLVREQEFGQLLRDRRPSTAFAHVGDGACQTDEIDAGVVVEPRVLCAGQASTRWGGKVSKRASERFSV